MAHMVGTGKAETARQPSIHMNAPMDFFRRDEINRPAHKDAGSNSEAKEKINGNHNDSIAGEQTSYVPWGLAERSVFWLLGSADLRVMLEMSSGE